MLLCQAAASRSSTRWRCKAPVARDECCFARRCERAEARRDGAARRRRVGRTRVHRDDKLDELVAVPDAGPWRQRRVDVGGLDMRARWRPGHARALPRVPCGTRRGICREPVRDCGSDPTKSTEKCTPWAGGSGGSCARGCLPVAPGKHLDQSKSACMWRASRRPAVLAAQVVDRHVVAPRAGSDSGVLATSATAHVLMRVST